MRGISKQPSIIDRSAFSHILLSSAILFNKMIQLKNLVPVPLKEKFQVRKSSIWNTEVTFNKGEWIKIKAPSGTGKTTLIHSLYKLRTDYEGSVSYNDKNILEVQDDALASLRQQNISIIFQDLRLFANLTARENIELNRVLQAPYYESAMIEQMADTLQITHILNQRTGLCSYGEQQRIAIVRALMQPFEWLFMDEPFSHLDMDNSERAARLIAQECRKRNAGFILTDLDEDTHFSYTRNLTL
ncbi:ATP-binding cassette domain-containing protein [Danxiaibacter flavus]|uniref:ATP-binding cassette domain-containing protein n=1 Tax=Danxiaibacter flavus TaxID=3049108 RepID=A0ABV3Z843_9BACT|nr:ATP-binding cassette domain-containing protein [Chitinophagaceae bacterium DXS]